MDACLRCGKETGEGELYCTECRAISGNSRRKGLWIFTVAFSSLLLVLAALVLWHGGFSFADFPLPRYWEKPAAVINGESISSRDLRARMRTIQGIVERQHGKDIFAGERGRVVFASLQEEVLNGMLAEKLMYQEARKLGIAVNDAQVKERLDRITQDIFGTAENLRARLQDDGMSQRDLQDNLRLVLISEALKKAKTPEGADSEVSFNAWLVQAKQKAELVIYDPGVGGMSIPGGGCCGPNPNGPSGGATGQPGTAGQVDPEIEKGAQKAGLEAFQKTNPREKEVTAKVTNYGCHLQVDIQKKGKIIKSYSYQGGKVFEIS
jgi:hypothetical protein